MDKSYDKYFEFTTEPIKRNMPVTHFGYLNLKQPKVEDVIFNNQATIVFWEDGEKTVVKCHECADGDCIYDRNKYSDEELDALEKALDNGEDWTGHKKLLARVMFCSAHFDKQTAVMAAMLKRLYPNFQDVLREVLGDENE